MGAYQTAVLATPRHGDRQRPNRTEGDRAYRSETGAQRWEKTRPDGNLACGTRRRCGGQDGKLGVWDGSRYVLGEGHMIGGWEGTRHRGCSRAVRGGC